MFQRDQLTLIMAISFVQCTYVGAGAQVANETHAQQVETSANKDSVDAPVQSSDNSGAPAQHGGDLQNTGVSSSVVAAPLSGLSLALYAITGKQPQPATQALLKDVIKIEKLSDRIRLTKSSGDLSEIAKDSQQGAEFYASLEKASTKAGKKFGEPVRDLVEGFNGVSLQGDRVYIDRTGADTIPIVTKQKQDKKYWVKELRLHEPSFAIAGTPTQPSIVDVQGVTVVLHTMSIPIDFRDFSRKLCDDGRTQFQVGIKNPLPRPLAGLFGMRDILHLKFTEGSSSKNVETDDAELNDQNNAPVQ